MNILNINIIPILMHFFRENYSEIGTVVHTATDCQLHKNHMTTNKNISK